MIDEVGGGGGGGGGGASERLRIPPPGFKISHLKLQRLQVCDSHHTMSDSITLMHAVYSIWLTEDVI